MEQEQDSWMLGKRLFIGVVLILMLLENTTASYTLYLTSFGTISSPPFINQFYGALSSTLTHTTQKLLTTDHLRDTTLEFVTTNL
eukprot:6237734-Ditylum_brightwellii.AAC.1